MNLYDGLNISAQYGKGEGVWVRRGRETKQEGHQINQSRASVVPERRTSNSRSKYSVNKCLKKIKNHQITVQERTLSYHLCSWQLSSVVLFHLRKTILKQEYKRNTFVRKKENTEKDS